jgi:hypothetical protein
MTRHRGETTFSLAKHGREGTGTTHKTWRLVR